MAPLCTARLALGLLALLAIHAAGQRGGGGRGVPRWGARGGGGKRGAKHAPPRESVAACASQGQQGDCRFRSPRGHVVMGKCVPMPGRQRRGGQLHCRPSRPPPHGSRPPPHGDKRGGAKPGEAAKPGERHGPPAMRKNSSLEACAGKSVEEACTFRPPVMGDQEARGFDRKGGSVRGGRGGGWAARKRDFKQRRAPPANARPSRPGVCVPMNLTGGKAASFCRPLPPEEATPACQELQQGDGCNFTTNGTDVYVNLRVTTGKQPMAETTGDVLASFFVNGEWTDPELFFSGSRQGQEMAKTFSLSAWPAKVTLTIWSNDAWCFWKIQVNDTVILRDPAGPTGSDKYHKDDDFQSFSDSRFWIEGPPSSQIFDVPSNSSTARSGQQSVKLRVHTATSKYAATKGSVFASFMVQEKWTEAGLVFAGAATGEEKVQTFDVNAWPDKVWIGINSSDAYSFWKITLNELDVILDPAGSGGSQEYDHMASFDEPDKFWIEAPPTSQTFGIPWKIGPRWAKKRRVRGSCQETWWDMMNGTLHCRPSSKEWKPHGLKNQGDKQAPNKMEPDWNVKSDAPEDETDPIKIHMVVASMNYDKLMQDARLRKSFETVTKEVIASEAGQGTYPEHVTLQLSKGSVVIDATVDPPAYISRPYLQKQLSQPSLAINLAKSIEALPGISGVSVGQPIVTAPSDDVIYVRGRVGKGGGGKSSTVGILAGVSVAAVCVSICSCVAVCLLIRKLKNKSADPDFNNGTTVVIGCAVSGQTNAASPGIPVNLQASGAGAKPATKTAW